MNRQSVFSLCGNLAFMGAAIAAGSAGLESALQWRVDTWLAVLLTTSVLSAAAMVISARH